MLERPAGVPEDWVLRDCANGCGEMVWVPDVKLTVITPVCSVNCAVALMDAWEPATPGRQHLETPECWCAPAVLLAADGSRTLEHR